MSEKKNSSIGIALLLVLIIGLIITVMGLSIVLIQMKNEKKEEVQEPERIEQVSNLPPPIPSEPIVPEDVEENVEENRENTTDKVLEEANITDNIDKTGLVGETTYTIERVATNHLDGFNVIIEDSKVYFELVDKEKVESYAITDFTINRIENEKEEITGFNGKVKNVYFYQVGQAVMPDSLAILFLMENGKVEYISYVDALQTTNLSSRGEIEGLNNITEIYSASAREWIDETGGPGWGSCIAKDSNNNYYSLEIAFEKNNIDLSKVN
ncbi:MAG: hypothetical protein IJ629_07475 [Clostridia bacterium]|nr:hypothetical protein [Clostridia bacterium]